MSSRKGTVNVSQFYTDVNNIIKSNKHLGKKVCQTKISNISLGGGHKLGDKAARDILSRYDKHIKF